MSSSSPSNTTSVSSTAMNSPIFSGLYTPLTQSNSINNQHDLNNNNIYHEKIKMIDESHFENHNTNSKQQLMNSFSNDCPCGHLHGAGQGHHDDLGAIGLADFPLLRGPD
ncbi:hypothetical protein KGF54_002395 [Candida jiufengensis]|uniref:uncharacterized protein n=1 Tax=Candida jiufengensis TaxID=497108 RepID=UPI0022247376|nr:uncharacterized protein KGF54_002395 [Candida jiufengensis]KAI5954619.1 hypothetical protein KGF54_002395 [Candida jiufengensis]